MATSEVELSSISGMIADPLAAPPPTSLPATETSPIHNGNSVNSSSSVETKTPEQTCGNCLPLECLRCELKLSKFKSFFFFFGGAIGCVFPYFSIYYKQLGFGPNQIGVIAGVRPLIGFYSGPLWGSLADRFRVRRIMLCCSALGWLIFITSIGFVPPPTQSDSQCVYVAEFLGKPYNGSTQPTGQGDDLRDYFFGLHKKKPGVDPEESLFESRGWAYDRASLMKVYVIIMVLVVLGELVQSPCGALADSGCIETLGAAEMNKYGHQRAWGSLGLGVFSMLVGGVISETRREVSVCGEPVVYSDYRIAFYFFAGCMFCCFVTTLFFRFQKQADDHSESRPRPNPMRVFRMFCTLHYGSWLFTMFFTGVCNGVIWGFLFWHLENIGATQLTLGVANGVSLFSEMCMFLVVFRILERTGCFLFMGLGLLGYTVRFIAFATIENPWIVLPFEVLQGFTFAGIWSVFTKYLCKGVPSEYLGTLQGFLHGVYWGLGAGTGHMIAGLSVENFGARVTFWMFAAGSFVNAVAFLIIQRCTTRPDVFGHYEELSEETKPAG